MSDQHGPEAHHPGHSHVTLQAMRSRVQPGSFPLLLVTGLLFYVLNGLAVDLPANAVVGRVAVACAGLYVLGASRTTLWLGCSSSRSGSRSKPACGRWIPGSAGCCRMG